jgi:very-short-patch-repair endonuclease
MSLSMQVSMFYNAKPNIFEKAKDLRNNMTFAELKLWELLKNKQVQGLRFRAQHPIDIFIADFYCHSLKLVIEVDGGVHLSPEQKEYDIGREAEINHWGIKIIRFTNDEIEKEIDEALKIINIICNKRKLGDGKSPLGDLGVGNCCEKEFDRVDLGVLYI